jgi:CubicO group peptidase (beta-lactamase class C family)
MEGSFEPAFKPVADAFAANPRGGSALTVLHHGHPVVDLHEGWRDAAHTTEWDDTTLVNIYSVGKPIIAASVMLLAHRGRVDLDSPVSTYWPEFQTEVSVRAVLAHLAALPAFPVPRPAEAWSNWDQLCADLAAATPEWQPNTIAAEHALTYGHLLGELIRRVDGRQPSSFVAEEIAQPLGLDLAFALPPQDLPRCAELEFETPDWPTKTQGTPGSVRARAVSNPPGARDLAVLNSPLWRQSAIPATNIHATARAIAGFYAALMDGRLPNLAIPQYTGEDLFIEDEVTWGLGVQIEQNGAWGHGGLGGNLGWLDPNRDTVIAYVTRRLGDFTAADQIEQALHQTIP